MKSLALITALTCLAALLVTPADALEYRIDAPQDYLFGEATSDATIYEWENPNVDRSKNVALIAPGFGTPTSSSQALYPSPCREGQRQGSLTPLLLLSPQSLKDGFVGAPLEHDTDSSAYPTVNTDSATIQQAPTFTPVTRDFYSLGTIKIPSIGLTVDIYEGTTSTAMLKGAGHFEGTSIWNGNCCFAGHNRGVRNDFGKLHTLKDGAVITLTTALGTRNYSVTSVSKVLSTDTSTSNPPYGPTNKNCAGWAILCSDAVFGNSPWRKVIAPRWEDIRVGDLIQYDNDMGGHAIIVTEKTDETLSYTDSEPSSKVYWGSQVPRTWLEQRPGLVLYTRYLN